MLRLCAPLDCFQKIDVYNKGHVQHHMKTFAMVYSRKFFQTTFIDNIAKHFDYLVCEQCHKDLLLWQS